MADQEHQIISLIPMIACAGGGCLFARRFVVFESFQRRGLATTTGGGLVVIAAGSLVDHRFDNKQKTIGARGTPGAAASTATDAAATGVAAQNLCWSIGFAVEIRRVAVAVDRQHLGVGDVWQIRRGGLVGQRRLRREDVPHVGPFDPPLQFAAGRDRHLFVELFDHLSTSTQTIGLEIRLMPVPYPPQERFFCAPPNEADW